jgi:hypothetical protein
VVVDVQIRQPLNLGSILNNKSDHFINAFGIKWVYLLYQAKKTTNKFVVFLTE